MAVFEDDDADVVLGALGHVGLETAVVAGVVGFDGLAGGGVDEPAEAVPGVGAALIVAMVISSMVGTLIPMFFHKIKIDPAVASGPLITTLNDLVAIITYYGLAWILLINVLHLV